MTKKANHQHGCSLVSRHGDTNIVVRDCVVLFGVLHEVLGANAMLAGEVAQTSASGFAQRTECVSMGHREPPTFP